MQTPDSNARQSIGSIPLENRSLKYSAVAVLLFSIASLLLMAPFYLEPYWLRVLSLMFMYASLAQGINLIAGFAGYPAFGNVVFFGLGAYSVAIVMVKGGGSFLIGLLVALALCMVSALLIGP